MSKKVTPVLLFLTLLNALNYLDSYIIAAVGPAMQRDLHLTDAMFGALGSAFLWGYLLTSPFFGRLADRFTRKVTMAAGVFLWSVATAATGIVGSFAALLAIRFLSGSGESDFAALGPTVLDDLAEPAKRGRILSVFYAAIPIGTALGYIYGGIMDREFSWQAAFIIAGIVGVLLVPLCFRYCEANPQKDERTMHRRLRDDFRTLIASRRYLWTVFGYAAQTFVLGGFAFWAPTLLMRKFAYSVITGNVIFGGIVIATGFAGTLFGGWLLDRLPGTDRNRNALTLSAIASFLAVPFGIVALMSTSSIVFFACLAVVQLALFVTFSPITTVFLGSVPSAIRATALGGSVFIGRMLGDAISIWLVGLLSDVTKNLSFAMLVLPFVLLISTVMWGMGARSKGLAVMR